MDRGSASRDESSASRFVSPEATSRLRRFVAPGATSRLRRLVSLEAGSPQEPPALVRAACAALLALVILEALEETSVLGGPVRLYRIGFHDTVLVGATALCLGRAWRRRQDRRAWLAFGCGLAIWTVGSTLWHGLYGLGRDAPYPSISDVLWLAWYPITGVGIVVLVRAHIKKFEFHQWLDGVALVGVLLAPVASLVLAPIADEATGSSLEVAVSLAYPVLDTLLIATVVGIYGLASWRPGRVWMVLGTGFTIMTVSDVVFASQQVTGSYLVGDYDFTWTLGALLIAVAAWLPGQVFGDQEPPRGWRAIAFPVTAQVIAVAIQLYAAIHPISEVERLVSAIVIVIAIIQLILTRPRHDSPSPTAIESEPLGPLQPTTQPVSPEPE